MKNQIGFKLAVRTDEKNGVIRGYFSMLDDSERIEISTLSLHAAQQHSKLFNAWKDALTDALKEFLEIGLGLEVTGFEEFRPHDKN